MKIFFKEQVKPPVNEYKVICNMTYGDGDIYNYLSVGGFEKGRDEALLEEFLNLCERMKHHDGRDYDNVEGFKKWFTDMEDLTEEEYETIPEHEKEILFNFWERDPLANRNVYAKFKSYLVYYYDEEGIQYRVEVEL